MQTKTAACVAYAIILFCNAAAGRAEDLWTDDLAAAKEKAAKEQKDLLVDFTGSDWCIWCQRLDKEVFDTPQFREQAPKSFVLVKLDFPRKTPLAPDKAKRNAELQKQFNVSGFPTILLLDAQGELFARTGYQPGGAENYLKHLAALVADKTKLAELRKQAADAEGAAKAAALDRLIQYQTEHGLPTDPAQFKAICELDADGKAGLKAKYEGQLLLLDLDQRLQSAYQARNLEEAGKVLDQGLASDKLAADQKQTLMVKKAEWSLRQGKHDDAIRTLQEAQKLAPESDLAKKIPAFIKQTEAMRPKAGAAGR